ncbi:XRE family transcriptional regulator [Pseudoduganella sp. SL102]|uniref:helix-turn-helix domain-containing protein n=1 Tax=Pseudoduganella sp. SL102 TaxID=2995154 RepID=UPI00248B4DB4|nr:XRE family transcriptional regulator [Pseudoduganella sp. SL102]WBS05138.1 XRE family transcriptional regulator [Pseudoduganella sp. SL102]
MTLRLKLLRKQKSWSLEELAERAELTKSYLSKVERGLSVPSIAVAIKLARALEVDIEQLISNSHAANDITVTRASERTSLGNQHADRHEVQSIASGAVSKRMLPFVVFPPREFTTSAFKEHEGEELLFVHKGRIEVAFPTHTVELAAGDSLYFNALIPHRTRSIGEEQAEVLVVVSHDGE